MCIVEKRSDLCITKEKARYCSALDHCETFVWSKKSKNYLPVLCKRINQEDICASDSLMKLCDRKKECVKYWTAVSKREYAELMPKESCAVCENVARANGLIRELNIKNGYQFSCDIYHDKAESDKENDYCISDKTVSSKCDIGEKYWCSSVDAAFECGSTKYNYCYNKVWNKLTPTNKDLCAAGSSYWCKNIQTALSCNAIMYCLKLPKLELLSAKCALGPEFWCASRENMQECKAISYCSMMPSLMKKKEKDTEEFLLPSNCIGGPRVWCVNIEKASLCNKVQACRMLGFPFSETVLDSKKEGKFKPQWQQPTDSIRGIKPTECYQGMEERCKSRGIARKCGPHVYTYCEKNVWKKGISDENCGLSLSNLCEIESLIEQCNMRQKCADYIDRNQLVFMQPRQEPDDDICARGPSVWCTTMGLAIQCKAVEYCKTYVWENKEVPSNTYCSRGPMYYCSSLKLAKECGKLAYCQENVWA